MGLREKYRLYRDSLARRDAFLAWARTKLPDDQCIAFFLSGITEFYVVKKNDREVRTERCSQRRPQYCMCVTGQFDSVRHAFSSDTEYARWKCFFKTPFFEIWEDVSGYESSTLPLWHGTTKEEQTFLLGVARKVLMHAVRTGKQLPAEVFKGKHARLEQPFSAVVAVWCRGELRGCMIMDGDTCTNAVHAAALRAQHDSRFKPLAVDDLPDMRIEISLFSDLSMPLLHTDMAQNEICTTMAYCMKKHLAEVWYFPEVFNTVRFERLSDFLLHLANRKGGFSYEGTHTTFSTVDDFIESASQPGCPLRLLGPVVAKDAPLSHAYIRQMGAAAATQLSQSIDNEGFIPGSISPFDVRTQSRAAWARSAFSAYALLAYGTQVTSNIYKDAALRAHAFLQNKIPAIPNTHERLLTLAYFGMAACALENKESVSWTYTNIIDTYKSASSSSVLLDLQITHFLLLMGDKHTVPLANELYEKVYRTFTEKRHTHGVAVEYADLLVVSRMLGPAYALQAEAISDWFISMQHDDGSFPVAQRNAVPYTRAIGKIFESLAYAPHRHGVALEKALKWLSPMQYTEENMFFIPQSRQILCKGGFRHDALNVDVWPDAAGHVLMGVTRLLKRDYSFLDKL